MAGCAAVAPVWLCRHGDVLLYLAPSMALAVVIRALARRHPFFFLFTLAGTLCHELAHFVVGLVTLARPASLSVVPRRTVGGWQLGAVTLARVRWYNAAPSALAPLLVLMLPWWVAVLRTTPGWRFRWLDLGLAMLLAPQFLACWPSPADWKIAVRSWPVLPAALAAWLGYSYVRGGVVRSLLQL